MGAAVSSGVMIIVGVESAFENTPWTLFCGVATQPDRKIEAMSSANNGSFFMRILMSQHPENNWSLDAD